MHEPTDTIYFVAIADSHIDEQPGYSQHGHVALPCAQRIVDEIDTLPQPPDFIIHLGDVTNGSDEAYAVAAKTFGRLDAPIYYVNGNHDVAAGILEHLTMGPRTTIAAEEDRLAYTFECKGARFLVLDSKGSPEIEPRGHLTPAQLEFLRQEMKAGGPPLVLFLHHPPLTMNSTWMDGNMLIDNGDALHEALLPAKGRLRCVLHGHVHQHMQIVKDGILYISIASTFSQLSAWPQDERTTYDLHHPPGYAFVQLLPDQLIVRQHVIPRP